jgi:hypothetical protein
MAESTYELKDGKFSMFKTENKSKENSPDFTGKGMFDGVEFRLSGWAKKSKDGKVYIQGSIQHPQNASAPATSAEVDDFLPSSDPLSSSPLDDDSPAPADTSRPNRNSTAANPDEDGLPFILTIPIAMGFLAQMLFNGLLFS